MTSSTCVHEPKNLVLTPSRREGLLDISFDCFLCNQHVLFYNCYPENYKITQQDSSTLTETTPTR